MRSKLRLVVLAAVVGLLSIAGGTYAVIGPLRDDTPDPECVDSQVGQATFNRNGPAADIYSGACP
jgi:hypothetical protein